MRSEFDFIQNIKGRYGLSRVGDDCAVLPKDSRTDLVVTADLLVEGVDFRLDWADPSSLGHKALAVSLSDVGAMGAVPVWALLSLGVPKQQWEAGFAEAFFEGFNRLATERGVEIVGGDVSKTPDAVVVDSIVAGEVPKGTALLRSGARVGDDLYVTGKLGAAAAGLKILEQGRRRDVGLPAWTERLIERQLRPMPPMSVSIREAGATAMIDLSDGLSSDLTHICRASGVGAELFADQIPVDDDIEHLSLGGDASLSLALDGGEDFELLFTIPPNLAGQAFAAEYFRIGRITDRPGVVELIGENYRQNLRPGGFRHF